MDKELLQKFPDVNSKDFELASVEFSRGNKILFIRILCEVKKPSEVSGLASWLDSAKSVFKDLGINSVVFVKDERRDNGSKAEK